MAKRVRYNGGTNSYYSCSDPSELVIGKEYEVVFSRDRGWQTDYTLYTLKGIIGEFNSIWFDEVPSVDNIFIAISHNVPVVGKNYYCHKIEFIDGHPNLVGCFIIIVKEINYIGNSIYQITTLNSVFIVHVG